MPSAVMTVMGAGLNQSSLLEQFRSTFASSAPHSLKCCDPGAWSAVEGQQYYLGRYLALEASTVPEAVAIVCS